MVSPANLKRPKVLIVGAGVGGITLAILLERAGVPYDVYERAAEVKPLGTCTCRLPMYSKLVAIMSYSSSYLRLLLKYDRQPA